MTCLQSSFDTLKVSNMLNEQRPDVFSRAVVPKHKDTGAFSIFIPLGCRCDVSSLPHFDFVLTSFFCVILRLPVSVCDV